MVVYDLGNIICVVTLDATIYLALTGVGITKKKWDGAYMKLDKDDSATN